MINNGYKQAPRGAFRCLQYKAPLTWAEGYKMKYDRIFLSELTNADQCFKAIEVIENDYNNYSGGFKQWISGYETVLKISAKKKIESIQRKIDRIMPDIENL